MPNLIVTVPLVGCPVRLHIPDQQDPFSPLPPLPPPMPPLLAPASRFAVPFPVPPPPARPCRSRLRSCLRSPPFPTPCHSPQHGYSVVPLKPGQVALCSGYRGCQPRDQTWLTFKIHQGFFQLHILGSIELLPVIYLDIVIGPYHPK